MHAVPQIDFTVPTRDLVRLLKVPPTTGEALPESVLWRVFIELRRRGEPEAGSHFIAGVRTLHRRRAMGSSELSLNDHDPDAHRLAEDPYLAELWKSYKRCLCANRTGPAAQILRGVASGQDRILVGGDAVLLDLLQRDFPVGYAHLLRWGQRWV